MGSIPTAASAGLDLLGLTARTRSTSAPPTRAGMAELANMESISSTVLARMDIKDQRARYENYAQVKYDPFVSLFLDAY